MDLRHDPSVWSEPHLQGGLFGQPPPAPAAPAAGAPSANPTLQYHPPTPQIEHSVWEEPALSPELLPQPPADALTYRRWLEDRMAATPVWRSWLVTFLLALAAGPWAVVGTFLAGSGEGAFALVVLVAVGPLIEEVMKVGAALWVVEVRPYWFRSPWQIAIGAAASGLAFAAIENLLYLQLYVPNPTPQLALWRWTVCVTLHTSCTLVAGIGLIRIWRRTMHDKTRPELSLGAPLLIAAIVLHGTYNALAVGFELLVTSISATTS
jgi:RsiW-degrading membrane proteinase PrsW (M82 family)